MMKNRYQTNDTGQVLVVDDHARARESMTDILQHAGHDVRCCASAVEALKQLENWSPDVIITDLKMPGMSGIEFIRALGQRNVEAQTVMVTAHATVSSAVDAMRLGAFDYIEKPFDADQLEQLIGRALEHGRADSINLSVPSAHGSDAVMIGSSPAMAQLRQRIQQVAPTNETVLITGESGTGKELVARQIHADSQRSSSKLISFNCAALSPQLMESELFGHEQGAFTGADKRRVGRFELADRGTVLLDEVTEIDLPLQAKLLRVLQEKMFERVGASTPLAVDVRVLATSNRDLAHEVASGQFRQDLFFRLAVVPIQVPPLRQRSSDIPELIEHFLNRCCQRLEKPTCQLDDSALDLLVSYSWPGNVRELENVATRACVLTGDQIITADLLRPWLIGGGAGLENSSSEPQATSTITVGTSLAEMERQLIEATLSHFQGHRVKTAQALGIGVRTLANKLRSYGYEPRTKAFSGAA
jgi:DNA-binding NtrC family response regulator